MCNHAKATCCKSLSWMKQRNGGLKRCWHGNRTWAETTNSWNINESIILSFLELNQIVFLVLIGHDYSVKAKRRFMHVDNHKDFRSCLHNTIITSCISQHLCTLYNLFISFVHWICVIAFYTCSENLPFSKQFML